MKKILIVVFLLVGVAAQSQTTNIYGDTVKLRARVGGNAEFVVQNATRDTLGFLYNIGGGVTIFKTINTLDSTGAKDTVWVKKQLKIPIKDTTAYSGHQHGRITFSPTLLNYFGDNGVAWLQLSGSSGSGYVLPYNGVSTNYLGGDSALHALPTPAGYALPYNGVSTDYLGGDSLLHSLPAGSGVDSLQPVLTAGSNLTTNNIIYGHSNDFTWRDFTNLNWTSNNRILSQAINVNTLSSLDSTYILAGSALTMSGVNVFSNGTTSNTWGTTGKTFVSDATGIKLNGDSYTVSNSTMPVMKDTLTGYLSHSHVDLTSQVKGILPVANGGTGAATFTNGVLIGNGTSAISSVAPGASGNVLQSDGTNWISGASGAATSVTSAATTLTMTTAVTDYTFTGTSAALWTLPFINASYKAIFYVKNRGTAKLIVRRAGVTMIGSDYVYNYGADTGILIYPGGAFRLQNDSTYWNTNQDVWARGSISGGTKNIVTLGQSTAADTLVVGVGYSMSGGINLNSEGGVYFGSFSKGLGLGVAPDNIYAIKASGQKKGLYINSTSTSDNGNWNINSFLSGTTTTLPAAYLGIKSYIAPTAAATASTIINFRAELFLPGNNTNINPITKVTGYDFFATGAPNGNTVGNLIQYRASPLDQPSIALLVSNSGVNQGFLFDSIANLSHIYGTGITTYGFRQLSNTLFDSTVNAFGSNTSIGTNAIPTAKLMLGAGTATVAPEKGTTGTLLSSITAYTKELSTNFYSTNSALNRYAEGGKIYGAYTDANNTGTSETDLYTYTTKANTLLLDGAELRYEVAGTFNDLTATCELKFYFGGVNIGSTGALTVSATGAWKANIIIIKSGSTTARSILTLSAPGTSTPSFTIETDLTGLTLSGTNIIKVTGTASGASGGSNDITAKLASLHWYGAANN